MIRNTRLARIFDNRLVSSGAWMVVFFLILGFSKGWAMAVRQCSMLAYFASVVCLVMAICLATSLREIRTDRTTQVSAALATVLGLVHYFLWGFRPVYFVSMFGVAAGAIIGGAVRFQLSSTRRSFYRSGRRLRARVRKRTQRINREKQG